MSGRGFEPNVRIATRVMRAVEEFVDTFRVRQEAGVLDSLLNYETFNGGILGQAPEEFTEQHLIIPLLEALGYQNGFGGDPDRPCFITQPSSYPKEHRNRPDFQIHDVDENIICFVESKAINREAEPTERAATEDIESYIDENTFSKFLQGTEHGYLAGIGTDGFRWTLWVKDLETGRVREDVLWTSIADVIRQTANDRLLESETEEGWLPDARREIADNFVAGFSYSNLPKIVLRGFE